jgi:hypothetical protein
MTQADERHDGQFPLLRNLATLEYVTEWRMQKAIQLLVGSDRDYSRLTGKPEVILLRRESAPAHLISRQIMHEALGDT